MRSSIVSVTGRQIRLGLALLVVLFACFVASDSHAQGGPTGSASSKPVPPRYNDDMNSCLCNCAGAEAGWECGVMDGPRCYYNPVVPPDEICGGAGPCLFSGWGCERGSPSAKCEDDCFNEVVLKPLCAEAVAQFGLPETATEDPSHLRVNKANLTDDMWKAIEQYNTWAAAGGQPEAHVSENMGGTLPALTWLFAYEGISEGISKRFVFLQDADRNKTGAKAPVGTEPALWRAITDYYDSNGQRPLTPQDVFFIALKQRNGDAREALLLAHNTLRSLARIGSNELTSVPNLSPDEFNAHFEVLRAPTGVKDTDSSSDSAGLWYHYFGMAYFETQFRGDQTPIALAAVSPLFAQGSGVEGQLQMSETLQELAIANSKGDRGRARSLAAKFINDAEQWGRENFQGSLNQKPDPEKYCLNLWAADVGTGLWDGLPAAPVDWSTTVGSFRKGYWETEDELRAATIGYVSEYGPRAALGAYPEFVRAWQWLTSNPVPTTPDETRRDISNRHRIVIGGSASDFTWQDADGNNLMMLDQETENLYGLYEIPLFPYYEEDSDTWGVAWMSPVDEAHKVVLTASADGPVHLTVIDPETGDVTAMAPELTTGQTVTLDFPAGQIAPVATMEDGTAIEPESFNLGMEDGEASATEEASGGFSFMSPLLLGGIAAALVVIGAFFVILRRPRQKPVTVAAMTTLPPAAAQESPVVVETVAAPIDVAETPAAAEEPAIVEEPQTAVEPAVIAESASVPIEEPAVVEEPGVASEPPVVEAPPPAQEPRVAVGDETCVCGATFAAGARFCRSCGAGVPQRQVPRCPSCGVEVVVGWRFCKGCGAKLQ